MKSRHFQQAVSNSLRCPSTTKASAPSVPFCSARYRSVMASCSFRPDHWRQSTQPFKSKSHDRTSTSFSTSSLKAPATSIDSSVSTHEKVSKEREPTTPAIATNDWLAEVIQKFKESTVDDATHFFLQCRGTMEESSDHFRIIAVLNSLHTSPQQSEAFVKTLERFAKEETIDATRICCRPNREHYHMVLQAWHDFQPPSAKRAQSLVEYMNQQAGMEYQIESCNMVLQTWAKKRNAEGAQAFFDDMTTEKGLTANLSSFSHILEAWSKSKSPLAAKRADNMLSLMRKRKIEPSPECLLYVIECWAKSKKKGAEAKIESLLAMMKRCVKNDPEKCNVEVMQAATCNVLKAYQSVRNAHRAEEILLDFANDFRSNQSMFPPTLEMCLAVLNTWPKSKSTRRAYRAEKLLLLMEKDDVLPTPSLECYNAVLHCYAGSRKIDSATRAEAILRRMENTKNIAPNLVSLNCVLIAWAQSDDANVASTEAERIFQEIQDRGLEPDRFVFTGLITAWGRNSKEDSIFKVEEYFERIKDMQQSLSSQELGIRHTSFKPTVVEYNAVIHAYANWVARNVDQSRMAVARVETLLDEMLESNDDNVRPNTLTYAAVLKTIAGARRIPDRSNRAHSIVRMMENENMEISPYIVGLLTKCNVREPKQKVENNDDD